MTGRLCPGRKDSDGSTAVFSWSAEPPQQRCQKKKEWLSHLQFTDLLKMGRLDSVQGRVRISRIRPQPHGGTAKPDLIPFFVEPVPHSRDLSSSRLYKTKTISSTFFFLYSFLTALKGFLTPNGKGEAAGAFRPSCGPGTAFPLSPYIVLGVTSKGSCCVPYFTEVRVVAPSVSFGTIRGSL